MPMQNTVVTQWIVFGLTLLTGIGLLVAQFVGAGNFTTPAIITLVVSALQFVLTQITKSDQRAIIAAYKRFGLIKK
jgi:hypothetical protein